MDEVIQVILILIGAGTVFYLFMKIGIYIIDNLLVSTDEETPLLSILDDEITKKTVEKVLNSTDWESEDNK